MFVEGKPVPASHERLSALLNGQAVRCCNAQAAVVSQGSVSIFCGHLRCWDVAFAVGNSSTNRDLLSCPLVCLSACAAPSDRTKRSTDWREFVRPDDVCRGAHDFFSRRLHHIAAVARQCQTGAHAGLRTTLSMADINEGFVKNTESTFGKPDASREAVRNARRVVVKVRLLCCKTVLEPRMCFPTSVAQPRTCW